MIRRQDCGYAEGLLATERAREDASNMLFLDLGVDYVNVLFVMIHQTKHLHTLSCMSSSLGSHGL